ncbi:hypothetical protein HETIRDRAFT_307532, partial [Heterobasidion irregulare TC 32-1]
QIMYGALLRYGEVLYFFQHKANNTMHTLTMVSLYGLENEFLLAESSGTVWVCQAQGNNTLVVINVKTILTCVAMVLYIFLIPDTDLLQLYLAMDKLGADIGNMGGASENDNNVSDDDNDHDEVLPVGV